MSVRLLPPSPPSVVWKAVLDTAENYGVRVTGLCGTAASTHKAARAMVPAVTLHLSQLFSAPSPAPQPSLTILVLGQ